MSFSWANQLAKTALKSAQQKIDSVLDIRPEDQATTQSVFVDDPLLTPVPQDEPQQDFDGDTSSQQEMPTEMLTDHWGSSWAPLAPNQELIVDSEPNPIRDTGTPVVPLLDHSPSSNSSDADPHQSPSKNIKEFSEMDVSQPSQSTNGSESEPIRDEPVLPPHPDMFRGSRRSSRHDDSVTVASSDIEVVRNVETWSLASSKLVSDGVSTHDLSDKAEIALYAQLQVAEQRRSELKASNEALQRNGVQLQQRIVILHQQQAAMKKELDDKNTELADLLEEGRKISDYSAKQSREIRRMKSEMSEMEKVKAERKRLREEKATQEETIEVQREEIEALKEMVKTLETESEQIKKENNLSAASTEVVQKHIDEQSKRVRELESQLAEEQGKRGEMEERNKEIVSELEGLKSREWAERLAGERANEREASAGMELEEGRQQLERLNRQLRDTQQQLEDVLQERNNVAETIARANAPLIEEINELKAQLMAEQEASEEADVKRRKNKKELEEMLVQRKNTEERFDAEMNRIRAELDMASRRNNVMEQEMERMKAGHSEALSKSKSLLLAKEETLRKLREEMEEIQGSNLSLTRKLQEIREENESLRVSYNELLEKQHQRSSSPEVMNSSIISHRREDQGEFEREHDVILPSNPLSYSISAQPSSAAQVELESMSHQYDSSMKRIGVLEREAARCAQLESHINQLQREIKDLNKQYNQLLEVDGERLEKIEELTHDIIDLRKLLKDQLIAFAEARDQTSQAPTE